MQDGTLDLEAFAHVVAHDLGAPIRGLSIHLRLLEKDLAAGDQEAAQERMGLLQQRLRRMDEMLRRVRQFSKVHVAGAQGGTSEVHVLVPEALEHVEAREAHIEMRGTATVQAPPLLVLMILQELLRNAIEHHDGKPSIEIDIQDDTVTITDDGPGLDPDEAFALFGGPGDKDGTGLALSRYIAQHLGGDLELASPVQDGRGTRATLRLCVSAAMNNGPS